MSSRTTKRMNHWKSCAVSTCPSPDDVTYHKFPTKDEQLQKAWIAACGRKTNINVRTMTVCSTHFADDCYERDLRAELLGLPPRKLLKKTAVPTREPPGGGGRKAPKAESPRDERIRRRERKELVAKLLDEPTHLEVAVNCTILSSSLQSEHEALQRKCREMSLELARTKGKLSKLQKAVERLQSKGYEESLVRKGVKKFLRDRCSPASVKVLMNPSQKYVHYGKVDIEQAIILRSISEKAFNYLRRNKSLNLPSRRTVERWLKNHGERPPPLDPLGGECEESESSNNSDVEEMLDDDDLHDVVV